MEADIAAFDHEHKRRGREQPDCRRNRMDMNYQGNGRLLMEIVVQIEPKADAHKYPEEAQPNQRRPAIFTRRPCCRCMDLHPSYPWQSGKHSDGRNAVMRNNRARRDLSHAFSKQHRFNLIVKSTRRTSIRSHEIPRQCGPFPTEVFYLRALLHPPKQNLSS